MTATAATATPADHDLAARLAAAAAGLLVDLRAQLDQPGADPRAVRAAGDRRSDDLLLAALAEVAPGDGVLSEETADDGRRLGARRVWIVDPLDGTREFGERGRDDWAVHVALAVDGVPAAGAVALPALGLVLSTAQPPALPTTPRGGRPRVAVSRSRPHPAAVAAAEAVGAELVPMGSSGAKAMAVVRGEVDAYIHAGGQYEWDSCAPAAVALAAGCHASRLDGSPLRYNRPDPYLPDLIICLPERADPLLAALAPLVPLPDPAFRH